MIKAGIKVLVTIDQAGIIWNIIATINEAGILVFLFWRNIKLSLSKNPRPLPRIDSSPLAQRWDQGMTLTRSSSRAQVLGNQPSGQLCLVRQSTWDKVLYLLFKSFVFILRHQTMTMLEIILQNFLCCERARERNREAGQVKQLMIWYDMILCIWYSDTTMYLH